MNISDEVMKIAQAYLSKVRRSGPENVMAICPFHVTASGGQERHPSFAMSLTKGLYFCHACGEKGTLFTFLKNLGISGVEIEFRYRYLIDEASRNVVPRPNPLQPDVIEQDPLPESLLGLFNYCPIGLLNAGFEEETLRRFEVGFDNQHFRVTYPLRDFKGHLVGISGRSVNDGWPKYKVYTTEYKTWELPERREPDKRKILFNSHVVWPMVYFAPPGVEIIIVEGFKACMWIWQAGIKNVVAILGTYLSWEHQWMIERLGGTVYLFLDNNEFGQAGIARAGAVLSKTSIVRVMQYPDRLKDEESAQPDNCRPEEIHQSKNNAIDYYHWRSNVYRRQPTWHSEKTQTN